MITSHGYSALNRRFGPSIYGGAFNCPRIRGIDVNHPVKCNSDIQVDDSDDQLQIHMELRVQTFKLH